MASATLAFSCSSLCATLKLPQNLNPLLLNVPPLSKPFSGVVSPPSLSRLSLLPVAAKRRRFQEIPEELKAEFEEFQRPPNQKPQLSDVLPDDFQAPEPGTPEYNDIINQFLPKKGPPPPREEIFAVVVVSFCSIFIFVLHFMWYPNDYFDILFCLLCKFIWFIELE